MEPAASAPEGGSPATPPWALGLVGAACVLGVLLPLWPAVRAGGAPGAGPDVVNTLWGAWWFSQVGPLHALGAWTDLVNHPAGAVGAVLSPTSAITWSLGRPVLGDGGAMVLAVAVQVLGLAAGTAWLAREAGASRGGAALAALAVVAARALPYGAGEGSVVAIAALPLPVGLGLLLRLHQGRGAWGSALGLAACAAAMAAEDPYLAPVLPGCTALATLAALPATARARLARLAVALGLGSVGILAVSAAFGRAASPTYPTEVAGSVVHLAGLELAVVDMPWARAAPLDLLWPGALEWTADLDSGRQHPGGGRYLGLVAGLLAASGLLLDRRRAAPWLALAAVGAVLGLGSMIGPVGGPFLYLNQLMDLVARPLTQPTRFLKVALVAGAVAAALAADAAARRAGPRVLGALVALVAIDAFAVGGPSLRLPVLALPTLACPEPLPPGAVLTWPTDATGAWGRGSILLQLQHERPSPHAGIASWRLQQPAALAQVHALGWDNRSRPQLNLPGLRALGFGVAVAEPHVDARELAWLVEDLGPPVQECGGHRVLSLALAAP